MVHIETIYEGCDSVHKIPLKKKKKKKTGSAGSRGSPGASRSEVVE